MKDKFKGITLLCVLVLLLASSCEEIKLFWHPEGPAEEPNPFLGSWKKDDDSFTTIVFTETSWSLNGNMVENGSYTYSGNSATLISQNLVEGGAQVVQGKLALSWFIMSGTYVR